MSSGIFLDAFYETDSGEICNLRIQPETAAAVINAATNAVPAGPATQLASAIARKGEREIGVGCRSITAAFASPPSGYTSESLIIPILTPAVFNGANLGDAVSYLGASGVVQGKSAESIR